MNKNQLLVGLGLGAGLMYLFDPDRGKRRRAQIRDTVTHTVNATENALGKASRDFTHRLSGMEAEVKSLFTCEEVNDEVLTARVRAQLGRFVSHPHAIKVECKDGKTILSGPVLAQETEALLIGVLAVSGVMEVEDWLEVHEQAENFPALQGGKERSGYRFELLQANWAPAPRVLAGAVGSVMALYGARRHDVLGTTLEVLGLGLLARGLTNVEMKDLIGMEGGRGFSIQKGINIQAPVEQVYEVWNQHENFPNFMSRVLEVKNLGEGRYHWKVAGPAGIPVEWEAVITKCIPNKLLAWESVEGSAIGQKGLVRFQPNENSGTRVEVQMSYHPPAGAAGHVIAKLFGADPKSEIVADLMRMKAFIETGHQPHDAAAKKAAKSTAH